MVLSAYHHSAASKACRMAYLSVQLFDLTQHRAQHR